MKVIIYFTLLIGFALAYDFHFYGFGISGADAIRNVNSQPRYFDIKQNKWIAPYFPYDISKIKDARGSEDPIMVGLTNKRVFKIWNLKNKTEFIVGDEETYFVDNGIGTFDYNLNWYATKAGIFIWGNFAVGNYINATEKDQVYLLSFDDTKDWSERRFSAYGPKERWTGMQRKGTWIIMENKTDEFVLHNNVWTKIDYTDVVSCAEIYTHYYCVFFDKTTNGTLIKKFAGNTWQTVASVPKDRDIHSYTIIGDTAYATFKKKDVKDESDNGYVFKYSSGSWSKIGKGVFVDNKMKPSSPYVAAMGGKLVVVCDTALYYKIQGSLPFAVRLSYYNFFNETSEYWDPNPLASEREIIGQFEDYYVVDGGEVFQNVVIDIAKWNTDTRIATSPFGTQWYGVDVDHDYAKDFTFYSPKVNCFARVGDKYYLGGKFRTANRGTEANSIIEVEPSGNVKALGTSNDVGVRTVVGDWKNKFKNPGSINVITPVGDVLYVGGLFTLAGGISVRNIAAYDLYSKEWQDVDGGVNGEVKNIVYVPEHNALYVLGSFNIAGNLTTIYGYACLVKYDLAKKAWAPMYVGIEETDWNNAKITYFKGGLLLNAKLIGKKNEPNFLFWDNDKWTHSGIPVTIYDHSRSFGSPNEMTVLDYHAFGETALVRAKEGFEKQLVYLLKVNLTAHLDKHPRSFHTEYKRFRCDTTMYTIHGDYAYCVDGPKVLIYDIKREHFVDSVDALSTSIVGFSGVGKSIVNVILVVLCITISLLF